MDDFQPDDFAPDSGGDDFQADDFQPDSTAPQQRGILGKTMDVYNKYVEPVSPTGLLKRADKGVRSLFNRAGEGVAETLGEKQVNPYLAAGAGTAVSMAPDLAMMAATPRKTADLGQKTVNSVYKKVAPSFLKSTKGIPPNVSRMTIDNPSIFKLPGTSQSVQGKSQDIIDAVRGAQRKVGDEFGSTYKEYGMESPIELIKRGTRPSKSILKTRSYESPGDLVERTQAIPSQSYRAIGDAGPTGINPAEITSGTSGPRVSVPGRSYTYLDDGPNKRLPVTDVDDTVPIFNQAKSFDDLRTEYQSALSGELFKTKDAIGAVTEIPANEKLRILTELKRSLQDRAIYPAAGQQLSPSQGAHNAAVKSMAAEIDQLRGTIPGGDKLAIADDAFAEVLELKQRLLSAFKDPYTGQDYLNRILKGNTDWLTSGRNAGRIGAIERIEQLTGKEVLKPALEEMAASYLNNPDTMGLASTGLKSIITALIPNSLFLKTPRMTTSILGKGGAAAASSRRLFSDGDQKILDVNDQGGKDSSYGQNSSIDNRKNANNYGNEQQYQNNQTGNIKGLGDQNSSKGVITEAKAREYLKKAGGDKKKARQLALADGWEVR